MSFTQSLSADPTNYDGSNKARLDIKRVDEFSIGENGTLLADKRGSARYLLKEYDHSRKLENPTKLIHIHDCDLGNRRIVNAGIVTSRDTLRDIANALYDVYLDGVYIVCQKYHGVIFIYRVETKNESVAKNTSFDMKLAEYSGRKFQNSIAKQKSLNVKYVPPSLRVPECVNDNVEFCGVFGAILGGLQILYSAQINGLTSDGKQYVESKTQLSNIGYGASFPKKALKWWMQSHLNTADKFMVGLHYNYRAIHEVKFLDFDSVLEYCPNVDVNVCFSFLETFLEAVKDNMQNLTEDEVLVVERKPKSYEFKFHVVGENDPSLKESCIIDEDFKKHFEQ
ncbi:decapping nuclease rai1 [Ditylenchus destructor]|nr:decapping nuclease rai1 [Ditylenchus destructor]